MQWHGAVGGRRWHPLFEQHWPRLAPPRLRLLLRFVRCRSTSGELGAGPGAGLTLRIRLDLQHLGDHHGSAKTGLIRCPTSDARASTSAVVGGSANATARTLPSNCRATAFEFPGSILRQGGNGVGTRRHRRQVDGRHLRQVRQCPDHHPRKGQVPADQQLGQGLASGLRLRQQGIQICLGVITTLHQGLGQTG